MKRVGSWPAETARMAWRRSQIWPGEQVRERRRRCGQDRGGGGRPWVTMETCGQCGGTKYDQSRCAERRSRRGAGTGVEEPATEAGKRRWRREQAGSCPFFLRVQGSSRRWHHTFEMVDYKEPRSSPSTHCCLATSKFHSWLLIDCF